MRDFAELGEFFDRPVRTYSSGMSLRLAFAVATHADAEVLIVDEALAVGDGYFQKKSIDRITEFHRRGGTLLFCSHALYYVALLCDEAIWLRNGRVAASGAALPVVRQYEAFLQEKERALAGDADTAAEAPAASAADGRRPARIAEVVVHDGSGYPRNEFATGESLAVDVEFETVDPSLAFHVRVGIDREDGVQTFAMDTRHEPWAPLTGRERYRLRLLVPDLPVAQGEFRVYVYLGDEKALHVHDLRILKPGFSVASPDYVVGLLRPRHVWTREEPARTGAVRGLLAGLLAGPGRGLVLTRGLAFLPEPRPGPTTARASRGSGGRAPRGRTCVEDWGPGDAAAGALVRAESWVFVPDSSALPLGMGRGGACHTLRELEASADGRRDGSEAEGRKRIGRKRTGRKESEGRRPPSSSGPGTCRPAGMKPSKTYISRLLAGTPPVFRVLPSFPVGDPSRERPSRGRRAPS